jgi:hypothetical protein
MVHHAVGSMVMACPLQHISNVELTSALQLVRQHREVRGDKVFDLLARAC